MSYYLFNRQEILQKAKKTYSKEKAAEYYLQNREVIKEKARNSCKNLSEEEKNKIKEYQKKRYQELIQCKKEALKNKQIFLFVHSMIMSEKTLKFMLKLIKNNFINPSKQLIQVQQILTKQQYLTNLDIVKKVRSILLVIKQMKSSKHYVLFCHK